MRIVFIIDQVYLHGGIERVLSIKANFLAKKGNDIFIITTEQKDKQPCYNFNSKINFKDLQTNYRRNKSYFHPLNLLKLPQHIYTLSRTIANIKPDVVVVCSHSTGTFFIPFINQNIPKVKEFHFSKFIEINSRKNPKNKLKKWFFKFTDYVESKYDRLIVLNKDEANYFKTDNFTIIPNPLTFFPEKISELNKKVVIAAGRIATVKGFDLLIDVWELVAKKNMGWKLHIYGEGETQYINILRKKIDELGLTESFIFMGKTNDIKQKMIASSIYVMTSHNECFPLVLLEAQACGLPIVSYDCPHGPKNIIVKDSGKIIEQYNTVQFANSLVDLMSQPEELKRLGTNARKNSERFQIPLVMKQWENMFEELIQTKTRN